MPNKNASDLNASLDYYLSETELPYTEREDDEWRYLKDGGKWKKPLPASQ